MKNWKSLLAAVLFSLSLFSAAAQNLTVTAPNGGQTWTAGTTHSITWTVSGSTANVWYYKVALSTDGGTTWPASGTANDLTPNGIVNPNARSFSWTISSSLNTTQARIRVRAIDFSGYIIATLSDTSDANFAISPSATVPASPTGLAASGGASAIGLGWNDNANNEQGYRIERKIGAGGTWVLYATVGANIAGYTDTGVVAGNTYYYRVYAYNAAGPSQYFSNEAYAALTGSVPASPTGLTATGAASSIGLSWTDNANNEQGFRIERKTGSGGTWGLYASVGANVKSYTDTGVVAGNTYYYRVYAYNAVGPSQYFSNEAYAALISAPSLSVSIPNGGENWTAGTTHSITWSVSGSTANVWYYKVALSTDGGATWPAAGTANDLTPDGIVDPNARTFSWTISSSLNTTQARIRVRAIDYTGTIIATASDTSDANFTITPSATVPASPTGLAAVGGTTAIGLGWNDNANNEQGYKIERKIGSGGTWGLYATVGANSGGYQDTGVVAGTTYYYRVYAYNAAGPSLYFSNEAFASLQTAPNLTPYQPPNWSDKIVVSRAPGNNTDSTSLTAADTLYVDWAVVNFGTAGAGSFSVSLSVDDVVKASWSVPSLSANYYVPVFDYNLGSLNSGQHTIKITADSTGAIGESNEADNSYTKTINIGGSALPDFQITSITLNPASPQPGQAFTANVTVKNQGTGSGDGKWLDVWANQPSVQTCGTDGNTWAAVGTLTSQQSKIFTLNLTAPGSAGSYTIRAFVDSYCQTAESSEGNNQATFAYTVGSVTQPLPNFVVTAITFNPAQPVGGQPFTAFVTVKNQGAVSGNGKYLDVWVNQPSPQSCGAPGGQAQPVGTLSVNQTKTLTYNLTAPSSGSPWTFRAFVDSTCQTPESNEGDNQLTASYGINPVAQPDFTITAITINPSNLKPGDKFSASVTVKNLGVSGNAGWLDVWANKPATATCGESGNSYSTLGTLAANETKVITVANLTAGPSGNNTLRAFIDSKCASTESDESNNQKTIAYKTSQRVLVLLHGMNAGPDTWDDYIGLRFNGSAPVISGGINMSGPSLPIPNADGIVCYRVDFGWYEINGSRTGIGGVLAGGDEKHGDFSTFAQLGDEVWDAIHYILSPNVYPGAQITLLGHSRGGLAARAFMQKAASSPEKASVVALLTTGTPHKGSRLGRIYAYLGNHPENTASGNYWKDDWDVVNFLRGYKSCGPFYFGFKIDVTYPTIEDLADNSTAITALQNTIQNLPAGIKYGAITYTGRDLGVLDHGYNIFNTFGYNFCYQLSSQAKDAILGVGNNGNNYPGDGIVPLTSQRFDDIPGFPAGNNYNPFPHAGGIPHTEETKAGQEAHMSDALKTLINW